MKNVNNSKKTNFHKTSNAKNHTKLNNSAKHNHNIGLKISAFSLKNNVKKQFASKQHNLKNIEKPKIVHNMQQK